MKNVWSENNKFDTYFLIQLTSDSLGTYHKWKVYKICLSLASTHAQSSLSTNPHKGTLPPIGTYSPDTSDTPLSPGAHSLCSFLLHGGLSLGLKIYYLIIYYLDHIMIWSSLGSFTSSNVFLFLLLPPSHLISETFKLFHSYYSLPF